MGIFEKIQSAAGKIQSVREKGKEKYQYTPERAKNLAFAKNISKRQISQEKFKSQRKTFERQQFMRRPEIARIKKFGAAVTKRMQKPGMTFKKNVYSMGGVTYRPSMSRRGSSRSSGKRTGKVGRPTGVYKYRNPITGQPMHVWDYRKLSSALKQRNQAIAAMTTQRQQMQLARQGIPPEQAQVIVQAREIRQAMAQPVSTGNQGVPIQVPIQQQQFVQPINLQQAEVQRIQTQVVPWERRAAMNRLMRQQRVQQMDQQQMQAPPEQRMEVSLLDGKAYPVNSGLGRRERWTYS